MAQQQNGVYLCNVPQVDRAIYGIRDASWIVSFCWVTAFSRVNIHKIGFGEKIEARLSFGLWLKIDADEADSVGADWARSTGQGYDGSGESAHRVPTYSAPD